MQDYERTTRATTLGDLPEPLRSAAVDEIESASLAVPSDSRAFLTHNRRLRKGGLFARATGIADKDPEHDTALVIGPRDVVVVVSGEHRGTTVMHARLEDAETGHGLGERFAAVPAEVLADGVEITGFPVSGYGTSGRGTYFVGLGSPDGDAARVALDDAIRAAKAQ